MIPHLVTAVLAGCVLAVGGISGLHGAVNSTSRPSIHPLSHRVVGYFGDWNQGLKEVQFNHISDLIFAFANEKGDDCRLTSGSSDAKSDFPFIRQMKAKYPKLSVLLSVGGGSYSRDFPAAVSSKTRINRLVESCVKLIRHTYPGVFDGMDVDWEGPSTPIQTREYTELIRTFRKRLGPKAPLTTAATASYAIAWKLVAPYLTWINLMTYDYHGTWGDAVTDFLAPIRADPNDPKYRHGYSIRGSLDAMVHLDRVPAAKILMGIPFYGYGYAHVRSRNHGLYQPYSGVPRFGTDAPGSFQYRDLVQHCVNKKGFKEHGPNPRSRERWLYRKHGDRGGTFISFDDRETVVEKAKLAKSLGLGGVMIWDLAFDTRSPKSSLTTALYNRLRPIS